MPGHKESAPATKYLHVWEFATLPPTAEQPCAVRPACNWRLQTLLGRISCHPRDADGVRCVSSRMDVDLAKIQKEFQLIPAVCRQWHNVVTVTKVSWWECCFLFFYTQLLSPLLNTSIVPYRIYSCVSEGKNEKLRYRWPPAWRSLQRNFSVTAQLAFCYLLVSSCRGLSAVSTSNFYNYPFQKYSEIIEILQADHRNDAQRSLESLIVFGRCVR